METLTALTPPWGNALVAEDRYWISDHHYGPGKGHPLEDFVQDEVLDGFVRKIVGDRRPGAMVELILGGDMEDPCAIDRGGWSGRDNMTESQAVKLLERIVAAHPLVYAAYRWFVGQSGVWLVKLIGNHDQFLMFRAVQRRFVEIVSGGDPEAAARISFVDERMGQEYFRRLVHNEHGHNNPLEPHCNVPNDSVVVERFGRPLPEPELRSILGNELIVLLMNPLKRKHPRLGKLRDESRTWPDMAMFEHEWVLQAFVLVVAVTAYLTVTGVWRIALNTGWWVALRTATAIVRSRLRAIFDSAGAKDKLHTAWAMAKGRAVGARVVIMHHTHKPKRQTEDNLTYINTGSAATQFELVDPSDEELRLRWRRFKRAEAVLRRLQRLDARQKLMRALRVAAMLGSLATFVATSVAFDRWRVLSIDMSDVKWPLLILFVPVAASIILRAIAVRAVQKDDTEFTFARVRHDADDPEEKGITHDLLRYDHTEDAFRDV